MLRGLFNNDEGNGLGNYGTYTNANGQSVGLSEDAYNAINSGGAIDGKISKNPGMGGTMKGIGQGVNALTGLANAYLGYQNYGLAKEKFAAEKATTNADYMAQAMGYNTGLQNSTNVGLALGGGSMTPEQVQAARDYTNSRKLSEKAIV